MSGRKLHPDEKTLWTGVARSVTPLRKRAVKRDDDPAAASAPQPKPKARPVAVAVAPTAVAPRPVPHPEPAPLGRKARRRLARGADMLGGRLDLHGMTQAEAHDALLGFLHRACERGDKVVLVITGKGSGDVYGGRGVLRRQVPMWLRLPEFRTLVVGFESAATGHGGDGALYVRLRRAGRMG